MNTGLATMRSANYAIISPVVTESKPEQAAGSQSADALVERLTQRDTRALAEVYELYGSTCFGFLLGTLRDRQTAEDVQQQVFLEVWQRAPTYDPARASLLTWIMTIARSRAIDQLRRRIPEPAGSAATDAMAGSVGDETEQLIERWHFAGLLRRLPPEEATVLRMRFYEELTQTEIAARTGIPLGTVKSRMVSGLKRLRGLMEER
jgi:RNA polymerase sigma-70 factor (ECF subfamily)